MALEHHERGVVVPGAYTQPPVHAPVASIEALVEGGYVAGPIAPMLGDFGPADTEWVDGLQDALMIMAGVMLRVGAVDPNVVDILVLRGEGGVRLVAVRAGDVVEAGTLGTPLKRETPVPGRVRRTVAATLMAVPAGPATPERAEAAAAVQRLLTIEGLARHARRLGPEPAEWETVLAELRARAAAAADRAGHVLFDDEMD